MANDVINVTAENAQVVSDEIVVISADDIIKVRQLPIIEEKLNKMRVDILLQVSEAMKLEPTAENKKLIMEKRKELNKLYKDLEGKRIQVKKSILRPYDEFEKLYKSTITDAIKPAVDDLSKKINSIDDVVKSELKRIAVEYFEEYRVANNIDFVSFEDVGLNITLNISKKKCKETCKDFIDRIVADLAAIENQEHSTEVLVEYKKTLELAQSISTVTRRYAAIEAEKKRIAAAEESRRQEAERQAQIEQIAQEEAEKQEPIQVPSVAPLPENEAVAVAEPEQSEPLYTISFTVKNMTRDDVIALKRFLPRKIVKYYVY